MRSDSEGIPAHIRSESTGRLSSKMASVVAPGGAWDRASSAAPMTSTADGSDAHGWQEATPLPPVPSGPQASPEAFLEEVARRLARQVPVPPPPPDPPRRYLGMSGGEWAKIIVGWVIAGSVATASWWLSVRDGLNERPTTPVVQRSIHEAVNAHGALVHVKTQEEINALRTQTQAIREAQIRQEQIDVSQTETLREIRDDVKTLRRRSR